MKKILWVLIPIIVLLFFGFLNRDVVSAKVNDALYQSQCDTPRYYSIGRIDGEFQISEPAFQQAVVEAAEIWRVAYGKPLFVYDSEAVLTVNLIYDTRQSLNSEINELNEELTEQDNVLKPEIAEHNRKSADLERRIAALNEEIQSWNARGGAPPDVYERLINEQNSLNKEVEALNAEANSLSLSTKSLNERINQLNQTVDTFNEALRYRPEGGKYIRNAEGERIEISVFDTRQELINVLAHEMAHALGLDHVANPESIMFSKATSTVVPSRDDLEQLTIACQKRNVIEMRVEKTAFILQSTLNRLLSKNNPQN